MRALNPIVRRMYRDYRRGLTMREVGEKHGGHTASSVFHLFKVRNLPRRRKQTRRMHVRRGLIERARLDPLVAQMHAEYMRPRSLHAVAAAYNRTPGAVRQMFKRRGLYIRPFKEIRRQANGSPVRYVPFTAHQIDAMIERATRIVVPPELKFEWRSWPLAKRADFIQRIRDRLRREDDRPQLPFSSNVEPFDYGSARAHEIIAALNVGRTSRTKVSRLRPVSQGVIYKGVLYFWTAEGNQPGTGAYYAGGWRPGKPRAALHHVIWRERHQRPIPPKHVIRQLDRNPNNLDPKNLVLATRNDLARENQAKALIDQSRAATALLLANTQNEHELTSNLLELRSRHRPVRSRHHPARGRFRGKGWPCAAR